MFFTRRESIQEKKSSGAIKKDSAPKAVEQTKKEEPQQEEKSAAVVNDAEFTTHISKNTRMTANIRTSDNFELFGTLDGDITGKAVVKIYGKVNGNVRAGTLVTHGAEITGEVICENAVVIGGDTKIKGNVYALSADISGEVSGNVFATESATVRRGGFVYGDLKTPALEVNKGGQIFGTVSMETPNAKAQVHMPKPDTEKPAEYSNAANQISTAQPQESASQPAGVSKTQEILDRLMQQNRAIEKAAIEAKQTVQTTQRTDATVWKLKT